MFAQIAAPVRHDSTVTTRVPEGFSAHQQLYHVPFRCHYPFFRGLDASLISEALPTSAGLQVYEPQALA